MLPLLQGHGPQVGGSPAGAPERPARKLKRGTRTVKTLRTNTSSDSLINQPTFIII